MQSIENLWMQVEQMPHLYRLVISVCIAVLGLLTIHFCRRSLVLFAHSRQLSQITLRPLHYIIRWGGYIIIIALVLANYGIPVLTMVGTLAAMVALGFVAMWSILTNITCTLLLIIFQPFQIDDEIEFPTEEGAKGKVEDMNFIYTTLTTESGDQFRIPNNLFFQKVFRRRKGTQSVSLESHIDGKNTGTL